MLSAQAYAPRKTNPILDMEIPRLLRMFKGGHGRRGACETHVQVPKIDKSAEYDSKQHGINNCVDEPVVEFDETPRGVEHKNDNCSN
jgi:hypothetical protein